MHTKGTQRGFIALMATIIISLVLLVMAVKEGNYGWSARFNVLGTEAKEQASALAEGCAEQALASLLTNPNYTGDATTTTSGGTCHIFPVQINFPVAGLVTIKTQANVRGSYANLDMAMHMNDLHLGGIPTAPTTGTLFITTHVVNDSSGTKQASDFTMNVAANPSSSFAGSESGVVVTVQPGAYSVSETALPDYSVSSSVDCSGTIVAGGIKFCTITNDDITTTLTLIANVTNDNGGTLLPSDFAMSIDGTSATLGTRYTVTAGAHTVSAVTPSGYAVSPWGYDCSGGGSITMTLGQNKTCIINFDDLPPPAPSCADTVMILDRTGSMSSGDLTNEGNAAKALTDLYAGVLPPATPPQLGVGSIGGLYRIAGVWPAASIPNDTDPYHGWLTTSYNALKSTITQITSSNSSVGSDLSAGITVAAAELNSSRHIAGKEKVLILVSDGDPNEPSGTVNGSVTLAPNAEGASTAWASNTGTKVSAVAVDDDNTSYITPTVPAQTYGFTNASVPGGATSITVTLHAVAKRASGYTASLSLMAEGGGNSAFDGGHTLSTSYVDYTWVMNTNPLTGNPWTAAEVNNWTTKFGVLNTSASGNVPRVTQLYVVVDYSTVSSGTSTKSPTTAVSPNSWSGATNVSTSNNVYATSATNGGQQGFGGFGLTIPAGATITGIAVTTEAKISGSVSATNTGTLYPQNDGNYRSWNGGANDIDETGAPSCSSGDYISTNNSNARSSFTLDLSSIPNGSTINSIAITPSDRGDSNAGGTYKTFVRVNGSNTDAAATLTAGSASGCVTRTAQTISLGLTKSSGTSVEIGVLKINSGGSSNNTVRVGALNAVINYTPPSGGALAITLSSNGGSSWTGTTRNTTVDATESVDAPSGNSSTDLWGRSWAPSDFTNFAVRVQNNATTGLTLSLDQIVVTVYYTTTTSGSSGNLSATSVGAFNNWPPNTGTAIAAVASNDNDTTSISNTPTSQGVQTFVFPNAAVPSGANNISVTLHAVAAESNGSNGNIRLIAEKGASQVTDGGHSLSGSYTDYSWTMNTNPMGGSWTVAEVNAWTVRFGVKDNSTGGTIPRVTQVYVVVNYSVSTDPVEAALDAADAAKLAGIDVFTIHFGSDPSGYSGRELLANLASGTTAVSGHQSGSVADAGGVVTGSTTASPTVQAATSGGDGNGFESNAAAALTDGPSGVGGAAQNIDGAGDRHLFSGYTFTVPPGAVITGIQTRLDWWLDSTSGTNSMGVELSWDGGNTWTAAKTNTNESTSVSNSRTLGATNDTWGHSWSASELSPANFKVRVTSNSTSGTRDFYLDWIPVTVSYSINQENGDGDNFFLAPTSADMQGIFNFIGNQVCPAALSVTAAPPPTTGTIIVMTQVINNNSGASVAGDFITNVSATNPSQTNFAGNASGVSITVDPGNYSITQNPITGYIETPGATCSSAGPSGAIAAGETRVCILTDDDIPPPPPPPNLNLNTGTWQEIPTAH